MARTKKEAALTPEERLQAALVPDWEWPYKLPENWCWTTIKNVATVVTGGTPAKNNPAYYGGKFPFFKPADLDVGRHVSEASEYLSDLGKSVSRVIPAQSTAVCCIGSIGKCGFLEVEGTTNQQINSAIPYFNALYQYFYMNTEFFLNQLRGSASATTIAIVNKTKMESCYYPLAPLAEQQRIVDRIESLFAKLDEAKEKAQAVVDSFETRKAAILHKAFTGELTAKWREEHGVGMDSWEVRTLDSVCSSIFDGDHMPPPKAESGIPFLVISNVNTGHLTFENTRFVPQEYYDTLSDTRKPQLGDVLYTLVGSFGIPVVVNSKKIYNGKCAYCGASIKIIPKSMFEIDHYIPQSATCFASKADAGNISNIVLSCRKCNHNKSKFLVGVEIQPLLHPDGSRISSAFFRDEMYYIRVANGQPSEVTEFYKQLDLGRQSCRMDYLLLNMKGLYDKTIHRPDLHNLLGQAINLLSEKRNESW